VSDNLIDKKTAMKKGVFFIFLSILATSCSQKAARVSYREIVPRTAGRSHSLKPSYMKGGYVKTNSGFVRDLSKDSDEDIYPSRSDSTAVVGDESRQSVRNARVVTVRRGDTLFALAKGSGCSIDDIIKLNELKPPYSLAVGQKIKLNCTIRENMDHLESRNAQEYSYVVIESGDTLSKIATNNDITLKELAKINSLDFPYKVNIGQKIKIPASYRRENGNIIKNFYVVKPGDNLYSIAHENGVSFTTLVKNNRLKKPYKLYIGQKLAMVSENKSEVIRDDSKDRETKTVERNRGDGVEKKVEKVDEGEAGTGNDQTQTTASASDASHVTDGIFLWPVNGEVIKNFGKQLNGNFNDAINIKAPSGTRIKSIAGGEVAYAGNELKGFGNIIIVKHENGWISVYGHCESINVKVKDKVQRGQIIGTVGKTGNVSESQLYFSLRKGRVAVDPLKYFVKTSLE
jgi:murein DD-endopeptidase MepM/ murein hydrolase activator NlpD